MRWYSVFEKANGEDHCIFDNNCPSDKWAIEWAKNHFANCGNPLRVFRGKRIGRLIAEITQMA